MDGKLLVYANHMSELGSEWKRLGAGSACGMVLIRGGVKKSGTFGAYPPPIFISKSFDNRIEIYSDN